MASNNGAVNTSCTQNAVWRRDIERTLDSARQLFDRSRTPISIYSAVPTNEPDIIKMNSLFADLRRVGFKDVETLLTLLTSEIQGQQDDNKLVLEHLVQLLSKLDIASPTANKLTAGFVNNLWSALPHPPLTSLGSRYKYREADGSCNNIREPDLGKAGTPYARSAKPEILQNVALPDPGDIFESLMVRGDTFEPHPNKISSMLFYLAIVIIHDIFRTDHIDFDQSNTSSYLDLAPLYGSFQSEQDTVRTFEDGRLKPDCFSEKRILGFPPGVGVLVIMFNRFHNHVVTMLAAINENGRFSKPKDSDPKEKWVKYDNDLFQTGRLITCGLYVNCILKDYVRTILSLNRAATKWDLDPRSTEGKTLFNDPAAEGTGNQVSAEFNLIYRWHSAVSDKDDKWTQGVYAKMFPGQEPAEVGLGQLLGALEAMEASMSDDPLKRNFADLKRQEDGTLNDDDLVEILESTISDVAGSFGANRVPRIFKSIEILGIIQARSWNLASLNEFREFAGLKKHATFEDINPDPEVAEKLRNLYDHPDYVELYPGLVAEKAKPPMSPGSGLCVNFTTSYAILSDAVSLVRGDRFYTIDYTPKSLTNWGFTEVNYDTSVDDGAVMYKLILRAFPNHFVGNSIYAHFPLVIPSENLVIQKSLNRAERYSWDKPVRKPPIIIIKDYPACKRILSDKENWKVTWGEAIIFMASQVKKKNGVDFALAGDKVANEQSRKMLTAGLHPSDWQFEVRKFYEETTRKLLRSYAYKSPGKKGVWEVDIVRDVSNLVNARFAASLFSLPIKTPETPNGIYTEQELYKVLALCFICIFNNTDVVKSLQVREAAHTLAQQLGELILLSTEAISKGGIVAGLLGMLHEHSKLTAYGTHIIERLLDSKLPVHDVVWSHILPTAASMTANQSQLFSQALDYYLGAGSKFIPDLYALSRTNTPEADHLLLHYFLEGARLAATVSVYRDYNPSTSCSPVAEVKLMDGTVAEVPYKHRVLLDLVSASRDPTVFPDPNEVRVDRPLQAYLQYGFGSHACIGADISKMALTSMFKVVFGLKNLRRVQGSAPGSVSCGESQGEMKTIDLQGVKAYMTPDQTSIFPFPTTCKIQWDEE